MKFWYQYGGVNQREIGRLMGVDYSSVSVGRKRLEETAAARNYKTKRGPFRCAASGW